jgi:hypothetical protein
VEKKVCSEILEENKEDEFLTLCPLATKFGFSVTAGNEAFFQKKKP